MQTLIILDCEFDWSIFANIIGAIANIGLLILGFFSIKYIIKQIGIAQNQIQQTKNMAEADIIIRINSNYFTEPTKQLFFLIENDLLIYRHESNIEENIDYHYFEVDLVRIKKFPRLYEYINDHIISVYTSSDVEFLILNNFEDLGIMKKNKLIMNNIIKENYSYYIVTTCKNNAINMFLKEIRKNSKELYSNVFELYNEFKSNEDQNLE